MCKIDEEKIFIDGYNWSKEVMEYEKLRRKGVNTDEDDKYLTEYGKKLKRVYWYLRKKALLILSLATLLVVIIATVILIGDNNPYFFHFAVVAYIPFLFFFFLDFYCCSWIPRYVSLPPRPYVSTIFMYLIILTIGIYKIITLL